MALFDPPAVTFTDVLENDVFMPGGILSTDRVTLAALPVDLTRISVEALPSGGMGGSQSGSALKVKATSAAVIWKGLTMNTGGWPSA